MVFCLLSHVEEISKQHHGYVAKVPEPVCEAIAYIDTHFAEKIVAQELADKIGIAIGTVKRFEKSGEIQFNHLLRLALVLGHLEEFVNIFEPADVPDSLYELKDTKPRQRARKK